MPAALWLLMFLRIRGGIRRALFSGSAKKTVTTVIGGIVMFMWMGNFLLRGITAKPHNTPPETMQLVGPVFLVIFTLLPLAFGGASRMLAFTPVEVDQLFTAPFSRRQLVVYRLVRMSFRSLFTGLFYALIFHAHAASWGAAFAAACLAWMFASFLTMTFALLEALAGARVRLLRFVPQLILLALLVIPIWSAIRLGKGTNGKEVMQTVVGAPALQAVATPFKPFLMLFTAQTASDMLLWTGVCLAIVLVTAFAAVRLDAAWLDASVQATHARAQRLELRAKGNKRAPGRFSARLKRFIPELRIAGPARAVIHRHLTAAPSVFLVPIIVPATLAAVLSFAYRATPTGSHDAILAVLPMLAIVMLLVVPAAARLDFRSDLDHYEFLKTLPLSHVAITFAQLVTPSALLIVLAWELLAIITLYGGPKPWMLGAALCVPPAAILLIAVENALFLFVPTRTTTQQVAALQVTGKRAIMLFAKFLVLGICGGLVALLILGVMALTHSILLAEVCAALLLTAEAAGACLLVAKIFKDFDVAIDMPD